MTTIETKNAKITYPNDPETKNKVYQKLIEWYAKYELFHGESIVQSDDGNINAPIIISEIVDDIIKFEIEWK
jgi:hypothetical protein